MRGRITLYVSITVLLLTVFVACSSRDRTDVHAQRNTDTSAGTVDTSEQLLSPRQDHAPAQVTEVILSENVIDIDGELSAGERQFKVSNHGKMDHNFTIEGPGIKRTFTPRLRPDETRVMDVDLAPGAYIVYCPLDDHRYKGMIVKLSVH